MRISLKCSRCSGTRRWWLVLPLSAVRFSVYLLFSSALCLSVVMFLAYPFDWSRLPRDAVLGVVFVLASGSSVLLVAKSGFSLERVKSLLYGNLLFASAKDLETIAFVLIPVVVCFFLFLRPMLYSFLDRESAKVLGVNAGLWEMLYFFMLGSSVAASSKIAGPVLVFCYLIVGPSAALLASRKLWLVISLAVSVNITATFGGMYWSYVRDLPTNQVISVFSCIIFLCALAVHIFKSLINKRII